MQWWVHEQYNIGGATPVISWAFWILFSISLHELAHGWAAIRQGDDTPRETGHMTGNPIVHMGGASLIMFALIGFAWGLMPTDPSRYRSGRRGRVVVAAAGPIMNLLLAAASLIALVIFANVAPTDTTLGGRIVTFFYLGGMLNLVLFGLNLLPVPPLDGSQILMGLSYRCYVWFQNPAVRQYSFFIVLALFFISPLGNWASRAAHMACNGFLGLFGLGMGPV